MGLFERKPPLPADHVPKWTAFLDCAGVIEAGRRTLLATLPVGRVDPAPITVGVDALANAIGDARSWMPAWRTDELADDWADCSSALDEAETGLATVREVAASTEELEELQMSIDAVIGPLDAFADAERSWRRRWKPPR